MWWTLSACGDTVAGKLLASNGTPLASVPVSAAGATAATDSDGGYRAPADVGVSFAFGGVTYAADAPRTEPYHLPAMRKVDVACPPDEACDVVVDFGTHDGLSATVRHACAPGVRFPLDAPNHEPTATCEAGRALFVDARTATIGLLPVGRRVEIRLEGSFDGCDVWVDNVPLKASGDGRWVGQALGAAWAGGRCGVRPLAPVALPADTDRGTLRVPPTGPDLQLGALAPWAEELVITDPAGWSVNVRAVDGVFALPALGRGDWRFEVRGAHPSEGSAAMWPSAPTAPGVVVLPAGPEYALGVWRSDGAPGPVAATGAGRAP